MHDTKTVPVDDLDNNQQVTTVNTDIFKYRQLCIASFIGDQFEWIHANVGGFLVNYTYSHGYFYFKNQEDLTAFKLRWA